MDIARYEDFRGWMVDRGRDPGTAALYVLHVKHAQEAAGGLFGRLGDRSLAPKTRHVIRAALRAWAKYNEDGKLLARLDDFKLPPARRKAQRKPLTEDELEKFQREIDKATYLRDHERAVLGIMATRGLRVGDVLRLTRKEVQDAMRTNVLAYVAKGDRQLEFSSKLFRKYLEFFLQRDGWKRVEDIVSPRSAPGADRRRIAGNLIRRKMRKVGARCRLDSEFMFPHTLRRTIATQFYEASGHDLVKLQLFMGWANLETASLYVNSMERKELEDIWERRKR